MIENGFVVLSNASGSRVNHFDGKYTLGESYDNKTFMWRAQCRCIPAIFEIETYGCNQSSI